MDILFELCSVQNNSLYTLGTSIEFCSVSVMKSLF